MNKKSIPFFSCNTCKNERDLKIGKCPFNFKPNLKIALRRNYNLSCLSCGHIAFLCPAEFIRNGPDKKPICGECYADTFYDDRYDSVNINDEELRKEQYLRKYGEY